MKIVITMKREKLKYACLMLRPPDKQDFQVKAQRTEHAILLFIHRP